MAALVDAAGRGPTPEGEAGRRSLAAIESARVLVIARQGGAADLDVLAEATRRAGVRAFEVTLDTPGALEWISAAGTRFGSELAIGAGTVTTPDEVASAIAAGAAFVVSPFLDPEVVARARELGRPAIPGTFTTTEIAQALRAGATTVKLFPATAADPAYVRQILAPMPAVRLIPTGGIDGRNAAAFIEAGAIAVGVGQAVMTPDLVARADVEALRDRLLEVVSSVARARRPER